MTIKFRGYLKNNNQLKSVDESRLEKMAIGWIDYLFVFLIILYPLTKSLKLLISKYKRGRCGQFLGPKGTRRRKTWHRRNKKKNELSPYMMN